MIDISGVVTESRSTPPLEGATRPRRRRQLTARDEPTSISEIAINCHYSLSSRPLVDVIGWALCGGDGGGGGVNVMVAMTTSVACSGYVALWVVPACCGCGWCGGYERSAVCC